MAGEREVVPAPRIENCCFVHHEGSTIVTRESTGDDGSWAVVTGWWSTLASNLSHPPRLSAQFPYSQ